MKFAVSMAAAALTALGLGSPAAAQLVSFKDGPVVFSHVGLFVGHVPEHQRFWALLGGMSVNPFGTGEMFKFPNIFVSVKPMVPTGGTEGTSVNHIGFQVPKLRAVVDKVKAAGFSVVTRAVLPAQYDVKDDIVFFPDRNAHAAFVMLPDDLKVELYENTLARFPVALHHIHFASQQVDEMKAWYVKVLNAVPGKRGILEAADLPGVNLTFASSAVPVTGTVGRVVDHISFEVKDLEAFCKQLEGKGIKLDRPFSKNAVMNLDVAFLKDPWGTSVELTEGYAKK